MSASEHHSFDIHLAVQYGIEEAIIIHHFQHWIRVNKKLKRNFIEGKTWTYQTREEIAAHFPYFEVEKVRRLCESLVIKKVLLSKHHHKNKFDRTLWYAFENEEKFLNIEIDSNKSYERQICQMEMSKLPNEDVEFANCIYTDTIPDTKQDISSPTSSLEKQQPPPTPKGGVNKKTPHFFITKKDMNYLNPKEEEVVVQEILPPKEEVRQPTIPTQKPKKAPPKYSKESAELVHFIATTAKKNDPKCSVVNVPDAVFRDRKFAEECLKNTEEEDSIALKTCKKIVLDSWADSFWKGRICSASNLKKHWNTLRAGLRGFQGASSKATTKPPGHLQKDIDGNAIVHPWELLKPGENIL